MSPVLPFSESPADPGYFGSFGQGPRTLQCTRQGHSFGQILSNGVHAHFSHAKLIFFLFLLLPLPLRLLPELAWVKERLAL